MMEGEGEGDIDENTRLLPPTDKANGKTSLRRQSFASLPSFREPYASSEESSSTVTIWTVVPILLLGVFIANADASLVIASSQHIASEFRALSDASWLVTSYGIAQCASQPLYGKLSDIFSRKYNLITSYAFFAVGCFICSISEVYWQVLAGRAISGIGGSGMTALVSIIIADMVPVRNVASWRSYVNIAATIGRSVGGPLGGWLTDTIGWRWSFFGQCPLAVVGLFLILWKLPLHTNRGDHSNEETLSQKVQRVDIAGSITIAATISTFLLALDLTSKDQPWYFVLIASSLFIVLAALFYGIEHRWATEPVLPIELLVNRDANTAYLIATAQTIAQVALYYSVPIYFQIAAETSVAGAGARLVPAVIGNAAGGLLSGVLISRTGRYKHLTNFASLIALVGYVLVFIRWRGTTSWPEVWYISLGGFGIGIIQSTTFVHLAASLDSSEMAIGGTTLYLVQNASALVGIQLVTTVLHARLRVNLDAGLQGVQHKSKIIEDSMSDISYIGRLPSHIKQIVVRSYVDGLTCTYGFSLLVAVLGLLSGLTLREGKL